MYVSGSERVNGPVYSCQSPPLTRYSVRSTPLPRPVAGGERDRHRLGAVRARRVGRRGRGRGGRRRRPRSPRTSTSLLSVAAVRVGHGQRRGVGPRLRVRVRRVRRRRDRRAVAEVPLVGHAARARAREADLRCRRSGTPSGARPASAARPCSRSARCRRSAPRGRSRRRPARRARRRARTSSPCTPRPSSACRAGCRRRPAGRRPRPSAGSNSRRVLDARARRCCAGTSGRPSTPASGAAVVVRVRVVAVHRAGHDGHAVVAEVRAQLRRRAAVVRRARSRRGPAG